MHEGDDLSLAEIYVGREVPRELEERVVRDLIERGWIDARRQPWLRWTMRAAAGFILFAAGWGLGRRDGPPPQAAPSFMLLLWEGADFVASTPAGSSAEEYAAWASDVASRGVSLSGNELGPERVTISPNGRGPSSLRDPTLGGYFIVEAASAEAARRLAEGHPHLRNGGWIEVAPIVSR